MELTKEQWEAWFVKNSMILTMEDYHRYFRTVVCNCHPTCTHWMVQIKEPLE